MALTDNICQVVQHRNERNELVCERHIKGSATAGRALVRYIENPRLGGFVDRRDSLRVIPCAVNHSDNWTCDYPK